MGRNPCCDKSKVKRGTWSPEEDAILKNYLQNYGTGGGWIALPHKAGLKRCGKSCRLRWLNYLRPDIKLGGFTQDEEYIISNLYIKIGSRWSFIASHMPGRTDNDVKNYWNTKLKKKLKAAAAASDAAAAAATSRIARPDYGSPASYPPESFANVPINVGPSRVVLEGSSDCLSGGNGMKLPFCPSQSQQESSPFWSFCMGVDGSNEVKMDEFSWEILSGILPQEEVGGDLFSILHFDSKQHGVSQN